MAQLSREHHYVPKCLSKRFANANGHLHGYLVNEHRFVRRVPKKIFVLTDLNNHLDENGVVHDVVERQLSKFETKASPILGRLVRDTRLGILPTLNQDEYDTWTAFFLLQWKRAPEFIERSDIFGSFEDVLHETLDEFAREVRPLTDQERERFVNPAVIELMKHNTRMMNATRLSEKALRTIRRRGIVLVKAASMGESLLIGSNPVMKVTPPDTTDLEDHRVEVWLPIAPDVLAGIGTTPNSIQVLDVSDPQLIPSINNDLLRQSSVIAGRSKSTVEAVLKRNGIEPKEPFQEKTLPSPA